MASKRTPARDLNTVAGWQAAIADAVQRPGAFVCGMCIISARTAGPWRALGPVSGWSTACATAYATACRMALTAPARHDVFARLWEVGAPQCVRVLVIGDNIYQIEADATAADLHLVIHRLQSAQFLPDDRLADAAVRRARSLYAAILVNPVQAHIDSLTAWVDACRTAVEQGQTIPNQPSSRWEPAVVDVAIMDKLLAKAIKLVQSDQEPL